MEEGFQLLLEYLFEALQIGNSIQSKILILQKEVLKRRIARFGTECYRLELLLSSSTPPWNALYLQKELELLAHQLVKDSSQLQDQNMSHDLIKSIQQIIASNIFTFGLGGLSIE